MTTVTRTADVCAPPLEGWSARPPAALRWAPYASPEAARSKSAPAIQARRVRE